MVKIIVAFVFALVLSACDQKSYDEVDLDRAVRGYEAGLRAGPKDLKQFGYCVYPVPRDEMTREYGNLYLTKFREGYFKGCDTARKRVVQTKKKAVVPKKHLVARNRCEA